MLSTEFGAQIDPSRQFSCAFCCFLDKDATFTVWVLLDEKLVCLITFSVCLECFASFVPFSGARCGSDVGLYSIVVSLLKASVAVVNRLLA